jgi:hypothetical protein
MGLLLSPMNQKLPFLSALAALALSGLLEAADPAPLAEVHAAAKAALEKFTRSLSTPELKRDHGFAADDDFSQLTFGEPVEQKLIPADLLANREVQDLSKLMKDTDVWYVPVVSQGKPACLVSVRRDGPGKWSGERLGMVDLARALRAVAAAWPADKGYRPVLVIVPSTKGFFFQIPQHPPANLTPLDIHAPAAANAETWKVLKPAETTIRALRQ